MHELKTFSLHDPCEDVTQVLDRDIHANVFRLIGSIPASNFIQFPKSSSQSLGLVGRFLYLEMRLLPSKVSLYLSASRFLLLILLYMVS